MKQRNKLFLLFSSAVLGSTLAIAIPQNTSTISAETVAAQPAAVNPSAPYANGVYPDTKLAYHKSGTQVNSTMAQFMGSDQFKEPKMTVTINGDNAILSFPAKDKASADMIKKFTVNGKPTVRKGTAFEVIVPSTSINGILKGYVEIVADIGEDEPFQEKQPVDIKINTRSIQKNVAPKPETKPESKPETKPESKPETKPESKPETKPESKPKTKSESKPKTKSESKSKSKNHSTSKSAREDVMVHYSANYFKYRTTKESTMAQFMGEKNGKTQLPGKARMYTHNGDQYVVLSARDGGKKDHQKYANMISSISLNGLNAFKREGNDFYFNLGKDNKQSSKQLTLNGRVVVNVPGVINENQPFTVMFNNRHETKLTSNNVETGKSVRDTSNPGSSSSSSVSSTAANGGAGKASVAVAKNSYYNYSAQFLKQGTSESSVMANYMLNAAHVEIKGNNATITVFANSGSSANMITHMTLGGQTASRSGNGYTVTLPKSELESVIAGHVDVDVPGVIHESQPFSLRLTPGFSGTPSAGGDSSSADGASAMGGSAAMGGNAFPMGSASNLNAANANSIAAAKKAADAKKNGAKNGDNIKNPDATAQAKDKEQSDMNKTFLSIGGIISAVLGYIGTTLGWNIFRG